MKECHRTNNPNVRFPSFHLAFILLNKYSPDQPAMRSLDKQAWGLQEAQRAPVDQPWGEGMHQGSVLQPLRPPDGSLHDL